MPGRPPGLMVIFVHMVSVWVPFYERVEGKPLRDYDEIQKEITLALREAGRRLDLPAEA